MGVNTKGFIHSENAKKFHDILPLIDYIRDNYEVTGVYPVNWEGIQISFKDGEDKRLLSVFTRYSSYVNEDYPKFKNTATFSPYTDKGYIVLFDVNCWGNSVDIIKGIVSHFGGGYMIENDCNDNWIEVKNENN